MARCSMAPDVVYHIRHFEMHLPVPAWCALGCKCVGPSAIHLAYILCTLKRSEMDEVSNSTVLVGHESVCQVSFSRP